MMQTDPPTPLPLPLPGAETRVLLSSWAQKRQSWRFQKTRQTWLLLHMYDCDQVCAQGRGGGDRGAEG